jgi:hypothetical protein
MSRSDDKKLFENFKRNCDLIEKLKKNDESTALFECY